MTECFAQKLLEMFTFVPERESLTVTNDFITGELMEKLRHSSSTEEEAKRRYYHQVRVF
jgi:N-acetylglucosamine-6-phosphate deacetylase